MSQKNTIAKETELEELVRRLAETEAALQGLLGSHVDAVLNPLDGAPILLRRTQAELLRQHDELEQKVEERTAALQRANKELRAANEELLVLNEELEAARMTIEQERARYRALFELAPNGY
ncbi:MAG TPA: hypothetical protein VLC95_10515, partial [Anaerolineae bacterium]|nr:hypothetical protein [Anaerolineae bacterium]